METAVDTAEKHFLTSHLLLTAIHHLLKVANGHGVFSLNDKMNVDKKLWRKMVSCLRNVKIS